MAFNRELPFIEIDGRILPGERSQTWGDPNVLFLSFLSFWRSLTRTKRPNPKSFGGSYEKEFQKEAQMMPPKREIDFFGGLLDVYVPLLLRHFSNGLTAIGNCPIKLKISP
jgi:hypothetical protein